MYMYNVPQNRHFIHLYITLIPKFLCTVYRRDWLIGTYYSY